MPCVELGYRLAFEHWGHGYATEGSRAAITFGFATGGLTEIVAMTAVGNERSQRVMERLGMRRNPADDFDHPNIVSGHRLRRHVLYRLTATSGPLANRKRGHRRVIVRTRKSSCF